MGYGSIEMCMEIYIAVSVWKYGVLYERDVCRSRYCVFGAAVWGILSVELTQKLFFFTLSMMINGFCKYKAVVSNYAHVRIF